MKMPNLQTQQLQHQLDQLSGKYDVLFAHWENYCRAIADATCNKSYRLDRVSGKPQQRHLRLFGYTLALRFMHNFDQAKISYLLTAYQTDQNEAPTEIATVSIDRLGNLVEFGENVSDAEECVAVHFKILLSHLANIQAR